jgi:hypothetical protein
MGGIDKIVAGEVQAYQHSLEADLRVLLKYWPIDRWGRPALAFYQGEFVGLCRADATIGQNACVLVPRQMARDQAALARSGVT